MFYFFELGNGKYAVIKGEQDINKSPIIIHGIIQVYLNLDNPERYEVVWETECSAELLESGEKELLENDVIEFTKKMIMEKLSQNFLRSLLPLVDSDDENESDN